MNAEIFAALKQLERERGIPTDYMVDKITQALTAAYKKNCEGYKENIHVILGEDGIAMYAQKEVVDEVVSPMTEITLEAAREIEGDPDWPKLEDERREFRKKWGHDPKYFIDSDWGAFRKAARTGFQDYRKLAGEVRQSATISSETEGETDAICYSVYDRHAYFLNMDCRRARTFDYVLDGKAGTMTLEPCEIRVVPRKK